MSTRIGWMIALLGLAALMASGQVTPKTWDEAMAEGRRNKYALETGEANFRLAVTLAAAFPATDPRVEECYCELAAIYYRFNQPDKGDAELAELVARLAEPDGTVGDRLVNGFFAAAEKSRKNNNYDVAEPRYHVALVAREMAYGKDDPRLTEVLLPLAELYRNTSRAALSEWALRKALTITVPRVGQDAPVLAPILTGLGIACSRQQKSAEAVTIYQWLQAIQRRTLPPADPAHFQTYMWLYDALHTWGRYPECLALLTEIDQYLALGRRVVDAKTFDDLERGWGSMLSRWAGIYARLGYYTEAEACYSQLLQQAEQIKWEAMIPYYLVTRAELFMKAARYDEARALLQRLLERQESANTLLLLAQCDLAEGDAEAAAPKIKKAAELSGMGRPGGNTYFPLLLLRLTGRKDEAVKRAQSGIRMLPKFYARDGIEAAEAKADLAEALLEAGKLSDAEPLYREVLARWEMVAGPEHRCVLPRLLALARCLTQCGKLTEAEELYQRALPIAEDAYGKDDPLVARVLREYAPCLRGLAKAVEADAMERRAQEIRAKRAPVEGWE